MNIAEIENIIGYTFKDKNLLSRSLTHLSTVPKGKGKSYEKMEFYGDAFLGFVIAEYLYQEKPNLSVGDMTKLRSKIVCTDNLRDATHNLGLWKHVRVAEAIAKQNQNRKLYADIFESILCAIYIDGGETPARKFIFDNLKMNFGSEKGEGFSDHKTALQEYVQAKKLGRIEYKTTWEGEVGNQPSFEITLFVDGNKMASAKSDSKKKADQLCAKQALLEFGVIGK